MGFGIAQAGALAGGAAAGLTRGAQLGAQKRYADQQELMQQYLPRIMSGDDNWQEDYVTDYTKKFGIAPKLSFGKKAANTGQSMAARDTSWEPGGNSTPHTVVPSLPGLDNIASSGSNAIAGY